MIRTEHEYQVAVQQLAGHRQAVEQQRAQLRATGLTPDEIEAVLEPMLSFGAGLVEAVAWYERVMRKNFPPIERLTQIGKLLVALRVANGITQKELAQRLGVTEPIVSRDERGEYHGISLDRAQRVLDALGVSLIAEVKFHPATASETVAAGND